MLDGFYQTDVYGHLDAGGENICEDGTSDGWYLGKGLIMTLVGFMDMGYISFL